MKDLTLLMQTGRGPCKQSGCGSHQCPVIKQTDKYFCPIKIKTQINILYNFRHKSHVDHVYDMV